ncbi:riboflavin transporter 2-like [Pristis pectinata]|uniref:riboflavin transporter 2-like n=1 Tax=Pristis pectinata TaxID=685728 RepID=UPI00223C928F|nr:riboflavin transporter 2-like [Pristis pectinata]XP_051871473.1 riboflavin transporter 2-like [Pristis pectinata]XP_051871474.1 riboflavin transporter 2-like [Pristis pectinata]XP_051871475.1 riboflavin transporter 2-like [Pristis pectinata]XP_051871476.1 riboflavin transporter 2-like [Pristis pectinata]XP_051871477.1 riboflavin transporter 2-like [Pristis pectinata]XP_051871478.1 riboflavin transporter 2-like [Pristis pectinata]XP_051871479.1 riboflavin transporter 2-like [Pristis pectin
MALIVHVLAALFGTGSWIAINGLWVELPLIVPEIPEHWYLPSYLTIIIQLANVGPLLVTLTHKFLPDRRVESAVIYAIVCIGIVASFLLPFFWRWTTLFAGSPRSLALLTLAFFLSLVDCTSSVTFLPFMARFRPKFLTSYFIGEGLSGLVPGLVALAQGVGVVNCVNASSNATSGLVAHYQPANFPPETFFFFLSGVMALCLLAFVLLNHHPRARRQRAAEEGYGERPGSASGGLELGGREGGPEQKPMIGRPDAGTKDGGIPRPQMVLIFLMLAWVNALTNAVLPSVQSYSCLPYGNLAYHLSAALGAVANPLACFVAMFYPNRSLKLIGFLTLAGTLVGSYIMGMAALSPCPWLVDSRAGTTLIVLSWVVFVGTLSYVKVMIGVILRDEGRTALVWCGAVVQLGSMLGALTMFPLVSVYNLFRSGDPCNTVCPV